MHISYEAGQLEDPAFIAEESMYKKTVSPKNAPDVETKIKINFKNGVPFRDAYKKVGEEYSK